MQTIRLRVNDNVYKNLMWLLKRFSKDKLEIIEEDEEFLSVQEGLNKSLEEVENGSEKFIDLKQLDDDLETDIRKYEK